MKKASRSSSLDGFKPYLKKRYEEYELSAVRLLDEIKGMGFEGGVDTVRRYLRTLKKDVVRTKKLTVRFETPPGKQAQADWAYCDKFDVPGVGKIGVYVFVMVLSYSRQMFVNFTTSMRMPELLRCHQAAFDFFGGWPEQILYDNMKQVRISPTKWNEQLLDFASHHGFTPKTHKPYRPRTKGKVERSVDYVKDNFLTGRTFEGIEDLNAQGLHWLQNKANVRIHGTTKRRPCDLLPEEKLTPVSSMPVYNFIDPVKRTVNWESMVRFGGSAYSVPPAFAGQTVTVVSDAGQVVIRAGDMIVAEHRQAAQAGQSIVDKEHMAELWKLTAEQTRNPGLSKWHVTFKQSVQQVALSDFEEVIG